MDYCTYSNNFSVELRTRLPTVYQTIKLIRLIHAKEVYMHSSNFSDLVSQSFERTWTGVFGEKFWVLSNPRNILSWFSENGKKDYSTACTLRALWSPKEQNEEWRAMRCEDSCSVHFSFQRCRCRSATTITKMPFDRWRGCPFVCMRNANTAFSNCSQDEAN